MKQKLQPHDMELFGDEIHARFDGLSELEKKKFLKENEEIKPYFQKTENKPEENSKK